MAGLLSATELAACRALQEATFDLTATQQRGSDDTWGTLNGPTIVATLPCRLATPSGPLLQVIAAQVGNVPAWIFTCSTTADLRVGDLLVIGTETYRVNTVMEPASYNTATRAVVTAVR